MENTGKTLRIFSTDSQIILKESLYNTENIVKNEVIK